MSYEWVIYLCGGCLVSGGYMGYYLDTKFRIDYFLYAVFLFVVWPIAAIIAFIYDKDES